MAFDLTSSGLRCGSSLPVKFVPGNSTSSNQLTFYWGTETNSIPGMSTSNTSYKEFTPSYGSYTHRYVEEGEDIWSEYTATCTNTFQIPSMSVGGRYILIVKFTNDTGSILSYGDEMYMKNIFRLPSQGSYYVISGGGTSKVTSWSGETRTQTKSSLDFNPFNVSFYGSSAGSVHNGGVSTDNVGSGSFDTWSKGATYYTTYFIHRLS